MFHSFGTIQSNALVPVATSWVVRGRKAASWPRLCRNPSPLMLRHIGLRAPIRASISSPVTVRSMRFRKCDSVSGRGFITGQESPMESAEPSLAADQHRWLAIAACGACASEVPRVRKIDRYAEDSAVRLYLRVQVLHQGPTASASLKL